MKWTWKHAATGYAAVGFAIWLISYIVEWNSRNTAGVGIGDALLGGWGDVVMLQWVKGYQGLLSGLFALAGGSFVLIAGRQQLVAAQAGALALRRTRLRSLLATVRLGFSRALLALETENVPAQDRALPLVQNALPELSGYSLEFAEIIGRAAHYAEAGLHRVASANWAHLQICPASWNRCETPSATA